MRWGREAAGALPVACSTKRVLLTLRSGDVREPHTWGLPGGKMEEDETPAEAALREMREEISYDGELLLIPSFVYREDDFAFHNFLALVTDEFEPELNWESDDYGWFELTDLPKPLHFGVKKLMPAARPQIASAIKECRKLIR
jgi:8-oxo-dGTP pyrophosphatase MutT (NUDIX family)